jgi:hypothetical protein
MFRKRRATCDHLGKFIYNQLQVGSDLSIRLVLSGAT